MTRRNRLPTGRCNPFVASAVATILVALTLPPRAAAQGPPDIALALRWHVVKIETKSWPARTGTGFVAREHGDGVFIVTALAVIGDAELLSITDARGADYSARFIHRSKEHGLAALYVPNWRGPRSADLESRPFVKGESLVILGFSGGVFKFVPVRADAEDRLGTTLPQEFVGGPVVSMSPRIVGVLGPTGAAVIPVGTVRVVLAAAVTQAAAATPGASPTAKATPTVAAARTPIPTPAPPPRTPPPPAISIAVFPAGAAVAIDERSIGQAPLTIPASQIGTGTHKIVASAPGRLTVLRPVAVDPSRQVTLFLPQTPRTDPPTLRGRDLLARVAASLQGGEPSDALSHLKELSAEAPAFAETKVYEATALWLQGNLREAESVVRAYINVHGERPASLDAYVLLGILKEEDSRHQEALTGYKLALKVQPRYAAELAKPVTATEVLIRTTAEQVAQTPANVPLRIRLGLMYEAKGRFREGMEQFKAVLFTDMGPLPPPLQPTIRTFPARAAVYLEDRLVGQSPVQIPQIRSNPLQIRVSLGGYAEIRRSVTVGSGSDFLFVLLPTLDGYARTKYAEDKIREGLRGFASGDWASATRALTDALESGREYYIKLHVYIATGYYAQGRISESLEQIRQYINRKDNDTTAMLAYALQGVIFDEQSQFGPALTGYKYALKLHPAMASVVNLPPVRDEKEIDGLRREAEGPGDPRLLYRLGIAYEGKGRLQDGMAALRRALFSLTTL